MRHTNPVESPGSSCSVFLSPASRGYVNDGRRYYPSPELDIPDTARFSKPSAPPGIELPEANAATKRVAAPVG